MPVAMEREVEVAVAWWTGYLERAVSEGTSTTSQAGLVATAAQVGVFREAFRVALTAYLLPSWRPEEPTWGQGTRAFGVRYGPDDVIATALDESGVRGSAWLPIKTTMWIDPGEVRVRIGRRAATETLWKGQIQRALSAP